ncbi:substrate-binding domain-containing protein [Roseibacillus persicicus]|uniref:substrate-binding domain-containing protein n=1 Tax=Roseibacillus persicicus TaxID=454148 RepID=UPI00398A99E9
MKKVGVERRYLATTAARHLANLIQEGVYLESLPGERRLAKDLGVGRNACRSALEELEIQGLISEAKPGCQRRILGRAQEKKSKTLLHLYSAYSEKQEVERRLFQREGELWEQAMGPCRHQRVDFQKTKNAQRILEKIVQQTEADALFLSSPTSPWIQAADELQLPVFCSGGEFSKSIPKFLTGAAHDFVSEVERALSRLKALGHRKVLVTVSKERSFLVQSTIESFCRKQNYQGDRHMLESWFPVFDASDKEKNMQMWKEAISRSKPTAVIVPGSSMLVSLYMFCFREQVRIPEELSVICLEHNDLLSWMSPIPVTMRYPEEQALRIFVNWMNGGLVSSGLHYLSLEQTSGGESVRALAE